MKLFLKLDSNGSFVTRHFVATLDAVKPLDKSVREFEWAGAESDIIYLKEVNGQLIVDETAKQADITKAELSRQMAVKKARLKALSEDLIQALAGETVPNLLERKQEFTTLHNELRAYENKSPREVNHGL